ncbi:MAG: Gfo/Idh/MocA family protein [Sphaerochaeta sp.]
MKKINICFIGTGWMGSTQLKTLSQIEYVEIVVVIEKNLAHAKKVISELGMSNIPITDNYEGALNKYKIDIVWIVSPNSYHAPQAIMAMERGIHVFCEKPASTTFIDFEKEIELSNANPTLMTMVDYVLYFNPMEQALMNIVKGGGFGVITQLQINYRHEVNISDGKNWKLSKAFMGDALGMGINHAISMIVNIMNIQTKPISVYATSYNSKVRGFEPDPVWNIMIRFANGSTAVCLGNIDRENGYDLYHNVSGSMGGFIFDSRVEYENKIRIWGDQLTNGQWVYPLKKDFSTDNKLIGEIKKDILLPDSGNVMNHQIQCAIEHFLNSVRTKHESSLSFRKSRIIAEIGWAAQVSAKIHKEISLPMIEEYCEIARNL